MVVANKIYSPNFTIGHVCSAAVNFSDIVDTGRLSGGHDHDWVHLHVTHTPVVRFFFHFKYQWPQWVNQEQECVRTNKLTSRWLFIVCHSPHHHRVGLLITIANQQQWRRPTQLKEREHKKLFICLLKNKQHDKLIYSEWRWPIKGTQRHSDSVTRCQRLDREPLRFGAFRMDGQTDS